MSSDEGSGDNTIDAVSVQGHQNLIQCVSEGENGSTREYRSQPGTQQAGASQVKFSQSCHRSYTGHTGITECLIPDIPEVWRCLPLRHQRWVGTPVRSHLTPGHVRTMGAAQLRWRGWGLPTVFGLGAIFDQKSSSKVAFATKVDEATFGSFRTWSYF